jgi:hypothetical protein
MGIRVKYFVPLLAAGAAVATIASAPAAVADQQGPPNPQNCISSTTSTKCVKQGDAEINSSIPAPYPGVYSIYGPYWAG